MASSPPASLNLPYRWARAVRRSLPASDFRLHDPTPVPPVPQSVPWGNLSLPEGFEVVGVGAGPVSAEPLPAVLGVESALPLPSAVGVVQANLGHVDLPFQPCVLHQPAVLIEDLAQPQPAVLSVEGSDRAGCVSSAPGIPRPWDRLSLPDGWAAALAAPLPPVSSPSSRVAAARPARPVSPFGFSRSVRPALPAPSAFLDAAVQLAVLPAPHSVRRPQRVCGECGEVHQFNQAQCRDLCFCGLRHRSAHFCDGIAVDSGLGIHHYLSTHRSPSITVHYLGSMERLCPHCHAQFFPGETVNCCHRGTVCVPIPEVPAHVHSLICSRSVLGQIRVYNMAMAMAYTGHQNLTPDWGMFTMGGKSFHRLSANYRNPQGPACFAQIYVLDTTAATARRLELFPSARGGSTLDAGVLAQLHDMLLGCNPWIERFHSSGMNNVPEVVWRSCDPASSLEGMGLGAMIEGCGRRNIVIRLKSGDGVNNEIHNIDDEHELYHPLAYVLLFPTGSGGWGSGLQRLNFDGSDAGKLTLAKWALYLIQRRSEGPSHLQSCGILTSELWCDVWAQVESMKLGFLRTPQAQSRLRTSRFCAVEDCFRNQGNLALEGTPMIMPASFVGGAKWYRALYHDAMSLPAHFGRPDIFLTMTCNPRWKEIIENIPEGVDPNPMVHADIVARVFYLKWMALMNDILVGQIFGAVLAFCWRIEWQFRGWPHVHCMLILARKLLSAQQIDGVVSAEIPDPVAHPELHALVTDLHIHGPFCDEIEPIARCRQRKKDKNNCRFRFPKDPQMFTVVCSNQFPLYRRRSRFTALVKGRTVSDEWVVPHNALLLLRYRCHINLEICTHLKVTKYCYKYVFKRPDETAIVIDEIEHFLTSRVLSVSEAVWRILGLRLHQEYPPVFRLDLHLPRQHRVTFGANDDWHDIEAQTTTLLQWFVLNQQDERARQYKYSEIPSQYVWKEDSWQERKRNCQNVGRIYVVGCQDSELFFLRRLLCIVRGATCFMDLLTFMGTSYPTFKEACEARGMLADDSEYVAAVQDMCNETCSVDSLRRQFTCLLVYCRPANGCAIFEMFLDELCGCEDATSEDVECTLWAMEAYCNEMGHSLAEMGFRLPALRMIVNYPNDCLDLHCHNRDVAFAKFSDEQRAAATLVLDAIAAGGGAVFYIQAAGGCGKSFWANGVTAAVRAQGLKPIVMAASALAATVLEGGRTAHSALKIPIDVDENTYCSADASVKSSVADSSCMFWDECSMVHEDTANCVNRSLQDWMGNSQLFGGKVVVFMGDFQQLLPVVRGGSGDNHTIMRTAWWPTVKVVQFTKSFRSDVPAYCLMLKEVGTGVVPAVTVPPECVEHDLDVFCDRVMGDYSTRQRHVVCLTLEDAACINARIIARLPGAVEVAAASDTPVNCRDPDLYSDEFIHSLNFPGAPPALLDLKIGARYMIMRNLDQGRSLVNGTEVTLVSMRTSSVTVLTSIGRNVVLPRINFVITPAESGLPFTLHRRQYPLIPAYALTVHRVQGQSLLGLGLFFSGDPFCHGLLYTALSRVRSWAAVCAYCSDADPCVFQNLVRRHIIAHLL